MRCGTGCIDVIHQHESLIFACRAIGFWLVGCKGAFEVSLAVASSEFLLMMRTPHLADQVRVADFCTASCQGFCKHLSLIVPTPPLSDAVGRNPRHKHLVRPSDCAHVVAEGWSGELCHYRTENQPSAELELGNQVSSDSPVEKRAPSTSEAQGLSPAIRTSPHR